MEFKKDWKHLKLSDLGEIVGGGTPSTKNESYYGGEIAWITPKDLSGYTSKYISKGERNITEEGLLNSSAKLLPKGTVLFSSRAPIGYIAIASNPVSTNQGFKSIVPNEITSSDFLYYLLKFKVDDIKNLGSGSTFSEVSGRVMKNIDVCVPDIKFQERIASILNAYDKKIETNNKIIANLEAQAKAIFKYYFVDFEPFRDGKFIDSDLGRIPEGWEISNLDKIANYKNGVAIKKFPPKDKDNSLPALKIRELNKNSTDESSDVVGNYIDESVKVYDGDVIFSWSGTLLVKIWTGGDAGLNQHLFKVTSEKYDKWFYYLWTLYHLEKFISIARDKATTMGHIKRSHLKEAKVLICDDNTYKKVDAILKPIIDLITDLGIQNQTLAQTRDALLPKLMAGEIDLEDLGGTYD